MKKTALADRTIYTNLVHLLRPSAR